MVTPLPADPPRKRWTRDECKRLQASGWPDYDGLELIDGQLISKKGAKRPHVNMLNAFMGFAFRTFGGDFVNINASIDVEPRENPKNEPVPDLIVLARRSDEINTNPIPTDVLLLTEVSDVTIGFDLNVKAALYARAGIAD